MEFDDFKSRLLKDVDFGPLPAAVEKLTEMVSTHEKQLNGKNGSVAKLEHAVASVKAGQDRITAGQSDLADSLKALARAVSAEESEEKKAERQAAEKRRDRRNQVVLGLIMFIGTIAVALITALFR